jgi:hypothetical protein
VPNGTALRQSECRSTLRLLRRQGGARGSDRGACAAALGVHRALFGSGAVFFRKSAATHEILNDLDRNVVMFCRGTSTEPGADKSYGQPFPTPTTPERRVPGTLVPRQATFAWSRASEPAFGDTPTKADPGAIGGAHDASRSGSTMSSCAPPCLSERRELRPADEERPDGLRGTRYLASEKSTTPVTEHRPIGALRASEVENSGSDA